MSTLTIREQRQLERKERVIKAAMKLALEGGYEAVQMRDVAARAEVAMGTIYRYFNSKDAVLVAGLCEWMDLVARRIDAMDLQADSDRERLAAVLGEASRASTKNPVLMKAMFAAMASTDPEVRPYKDQVDLHFRNMINSAFRDDSDVDVAAVQRVLGHVWFSSIISWVTEQRSAESVSDELAAAVELLLP